MSAIEPTDELLEEMIDALFELASGGEFASEEDLNHGLRRVFEVVTRGRCMEAAGHVYHPLVARPVPVEPPRLGGQVATWMPPDGEP